MTSEPVRVEYDGDVAVVVIDNPPVNAGSAEVRRGLEAAVATVGQRDGLVAVVLIGAGGTFIAGSDIREFDGPIALPELPAVLAAIAASPLPFVAAIDGNALGGGFELALACDARMATAATYVGLPEVQLGIIPGAGGTQLVPRVVGYARAIELITSGRRVKAPEALEHGLIDRIAEGDLRAAAIAFARERGGGKRRLSELPPPMLDETTFSEAAAAAMRKARGVTAVDEAIRAIRAAASMPIAEALTMERSTFNTLRRSPEAAALRHLFFAERGASRIMRDIEPMPVSKVGIVGLGLMGAGIAASLLVSGASVVGFDRDAATTDAGVERIAALIGRMKLPEPERAAAVARLQAAYQLSELGSADLVIEAVHEDMELKRTIFAELAAHLGPETLVASNTSYLDIDALAAASGRPDRFAGFHFFSPAHVMKLVEIVRGAGTSDRTLASLVRAASRAGKVPIIAGNAEGFIGNRIFSAYRAECEILLEDGASPSEVDRALVDFGMAMGPFAVADMSGLDIAWAMRKRLAPHRDPNVRYPGIADRLCEAGRFGRKSGAGWYRYPEGSAEPDPAVEAVIEETARSHGIVRRPIASDEIVRRAIGKMASEAEHVLAAGTASSEADIDLVLVHGYGFPRAKGGPLFWARRNAAA